MATARRPWLTLTPSNEEKTLPAILPPRRLARSAIWAANTEKSPPIRSRLRTTTRTHPFPRASAPTSATEASSSTSPTRPASHARTSSLCRVATVAVLTEPTLLALSAQPARVARPLPRLQRALSPLRRLRTPWTLSWTSQPRPWWLYCSCYKPRNISRWIGTRQFHVTRGLAMGCRQIAKAVFSSWAEGLKSLEGNREGVTDIQYDKMVKWSTLARGKNLDWPSRGDALWGAFLMFMIPQAHRSLLF